MFCVWIENSPGIFSVSSFSLLALDVTLGCGFGSESSSDANLDPDPNLIDIRYRYWVTDSVRIIT